MPREEIIVNMSSAPSKAVITEIGLIIGVVLISFVLGILFEKYLQSNQDKKERKIDNIPTTERIVKESNKPTRPPEEPTETGK